MGEGEARLAGGGEVGLEWRGGGSTALKGDKIGGDKTSLLVGALSSVNHNRLM